MSEERRAMAIVVTVESNGDDVPATVRILGPSGTSWSAALNLRNEKNVASTIADCVGNELAVLFERWES